MMVMIIFSDTYIYDFLINSYLLLQVFFLIASDMFSMYGSESFILKYCFLKVSQLKKKHYIKNSTKDKAKIEKMSDKQKSLVNFDPEPYTPAVLNQKLQKWGPEIYIFNKYSQMIFIH